MVRLADMESLTIFFLTIYPNLFRNYKRLNKWKISLRELNYGRNK